MYSKLVAFMWREWRSESHHRSFLKLLNQLSVGALSSSSPSTHRAGHAVLLELVLKRMAGVLAAPVGVMHRPCCWALLEPSTMVTASSINWWSAARPQTADRPIDEPPIATEPASSPPVV